MSKALASGADAVIFDLEDSVPIAARRKPVYVAKAIDGVAAAGAAHRGPAIYVRVNAASTGLLEDDLAAVVRPGLDAILLSKAENVEEIEAAAGAMERHEAAHKMKAGAVEIILQIETALGVYRCYELIKATPRVAGTCIGVARDGDLQTDLGCGWSIEGTELVCALKVLLETRAAGRPYVRWTVYSAI
jgi:citrate lyase subunit beta/citryl-CoA lyase